MSFKPSTFEAKIKNDEGVAHSQAKGYDENAKDSATEEEEDDDSDELIDEGAKAIGAQNKGAVEEKHHIKKKVAPKKQNGKGSAKGKEKQKLYASFKLKDSSTAFLMISGTDTLIRIHKDGSYAYYTPLEDEYETASGLKLKIDKSGKIKKILKDVDSLYLHKETIFTSNSPACNEMKFLAAKHFMSEDGVGGPRWAPAIEYQLQVNYPDLIKLSVVPHEKEKGKFYVFFYNTVGDVGCVLNRYYALADENSLNAATLAVRFKEYKMLRPLSEEQAQDPQNEIELIVNENKLVYLRNGRIDLSTLSFPLSQKELEKVRKAQEEERIATELLMKEGIVYSNGSPGTEGDGKSSGMSKGGNERGGTSGSSNKPASEKPPFTGSSNIR